jgi:hypothetical protein
MFVHFNKDSRFCNITKKTYLREDPHDIVLDCDTARGTQVLGSLWDKLIEEGFQYKPSQDKSQELIKEIKFTRDGKTFHTIDKYIFPPKNLYSLDE